MIAEPAAARLALPLLEQITQDLLAWERAEGLEVLQVWQNDWGIWNFEWRKPTGRGSRDRYEHGYIYGNNMDSRYQRLVADLIDAGKPLRVQVTHVAKPLKPAGVLLVWSRDAAGRLQHSKTTIQNMED